MGISARKFSKKSFSLKKRRDRSTPQDSLNLLIFKDNFAARTFQVPLSWITRFGILIGIGVLVLVISLFFTAKFYRATLKSNPALVIDLERQLEKSQSELKRLRSQKADASPVAPQPSPTPTTEVEAGTPLQFVAGLTTSIEFLPASEPVSVKVNGVKFKWEKAGKYRTLSLRFSINYVLRDGKSQQGRFIVLAKGKNQFYAYPSQVLNWSAENKTLSGENGEYFSVSRIRPVKMSFGPLESRSDIQRVDIIILNKENQLILLETLNVE